MKLLQVVAAILFLVMTAGLTYGLTVGDFWGDGGKITSLLWGNLTLLDFYVGATYICIWVGFREKSWWRALLWIVLVLGLGNWTTSLYVFLAARSANGDWKSFFMGRRA